MSAKKYQNQLLHTPYAEIVEFFKSHPAVWYTIQRMVNEKC